MSGRDICPICRGSGNIITFARGIEYWPCHCAGAGVTVQHGPPTFMHGRRKQHQPKEPS